MPALGDRIRQWCEQESLAVSVERDDDAGLSCAVVLPGEPPVSPSVRADAPRLDRLLVSHSFELQLRDDVRQNADARRELATLVERTAFGRPGLIEARLTDSGNTLKVEITATVHEDGLSKQSFLTALHEMRKVRQAIDWGLESMLAGADAMSDMAKLLEDMGTAMVQMAPPAEPAPEPAPAPVATPAARAAQTDAAPAAEEEPAPAVAGRFCMGCGRPLEPASRFCVGCGRPVGA